MHKWIECNPRWIHQRAGMVKEIIGITVVDRTRAKNKLIKRVKRRGFDPEQIEYEAGIS